MMSCKPNPIRHMVVWGVGSGLLLGLLFGISLIAVLESVSIVEFLAILTDPFIMLALVYGMGMGVLAGGILGFLDGLILRLMTHFIPLPYTQIDVAKSKRIAYPLIFLLTLISGMILAQNVFTSDGIVFWTIPPVIAAFAATYATKRYLLRLQVWSNSLNARKPKAKNDHLPRKRLADMSHSDAMLEDELTDRAKRNYQ